MKPLLVRISKFARLLTVFAVLAQNAFSQCEISTKFGTKAVDWDAVFTQNAPGSGLEPKGSAGWTGGDSTYSILLPNGDSAFFFSDSYIAESPIVKGDGTVLVNKRGLRTRVPNCVPPICAQPASIHTVYNSIVVRSADGKILKTKVGDKNANGFSTSYFKPATPNHFYWLGDAAVVQPKRNEARKIWIFLYEWDTNKPGEPFRLDFKGNHLAQLDAETLAIESIDRLENVTGDESHWGTALWLEGDYDQAALYIYGKKTIGGKKKPFVARIDPKIGVKAAKNIENWKFWNGEKWVAGIENAVSIVPDADSVSDELSVKKFTIDGQARYLMVSMDTSVIYLDWKDIYLYSSCAPEGPFNHKRLVYTTPETGSRKLPGMTDAQKLDNKLVVYNPHLHPQFTENGELLISYNSNLPFASSRGDTLYADVYRPRFVRVAVDGLK